MNHDQNFKNLILDYPCKALRFFVKAEAASIDPGARIIPIQLKERLGDRFRELDIPLLVEWPMVGAKPCCSSSKKKASQAVSPSTALPTTVSTCRNCSKLTGS